MNHTSSSPKGLQNALQPVLISCLLKYMYLFEYFFFMYGLGLLFVMHLTNLKVQNATLKYHSITTKHMDDLMFNLKCL